jgi:hypothetical protein
MGNDLGKIPKWGKSAQVAYKQRSLTNRQCEYSQHVVCAKLTSAIHDTVTALLVAQAFCDHWAYVYGPPVSLLTDNGPQFTAKFFQAVCSDLGIRKIFTTAYHPQTNRQVEQYNQTILASLRGYVSKRKDDWDDFASAINFAYNCRVHSSLCMPPFELALTRPPHTLALQALPRADEVAPNTLKREFLERLKTLRLRAGENLHKAQVRYKRAMTAG